MRVVFCTKGDRLLPSSRTRAHFVADYLRTQGVDAESHHIKTRPWWDLSVERFSDLRKNTRLLRSVGKDDILYLHKMTDQVDFMFLVLLRKWLFGRGFIFDFDDAIFLPTPNRAAKAWLMVKNADAVVVGSHFLQEYALRHNPHSYVLSAPIDTEGVYLPAKERRPGPLRIGWTGTPGHFENMKLLLEPFARLIKEGYDFEFLQLGGGDRIHELMSSVEGLKTVFVPELPWDQPAEVVKRMREFDIGVMPLQRTQANRGKDAWKAKEYMGCGVATVLSDWGENPYVVTDGVDGFLPNTPEEWYAAFKRLLDDDVLRRNIGTAGRKRMEDEFSYKTFLPRMLAIVAEVRKS